MSPSHSLNVLVGAAALTLTACSSGVGEASVAQAPAVSQFETTVPDALPMADEPTANDPATSSPTSVAVISTPPIELAPYGPAGSEQGLDWLATDAALAVLVDLDADAVDVRDAIDLSGMPNLADRVAIGLEALSIPFTRSATPDAMGEYGTSFTIHASPTALVERRHFERQQSPNRKVDAVWEQTHTARRTGVDIAVASMGRTLAEGDWLVGRTGLLQPGAPEVPASVDGGVGWNNREAQEYVERTVAFDGEGMVISTRNRRTAPNVEQLPYVSGLVVSHETLRWGTVEVTAELPEGDGVWPAIWMLDDEACDNPGRCPGYETTAYHEIDIIETKGQEPSIGHFSVHWRGERIRSHSSTATIGAGEQVFALERRPGLLIWRVDGEVVSVLTGRVDSFETGPHRNRPMRLVINTAVGGFFAGDSELGRNGQWWGDAYVPASFPEVQLQAGFAIESVIVDPR